MRATEVLIIGSGAAGLSCALRLAELGHGVTVVSKGNLSSGSTLWAQGGISAVLHEDDSLEAHLRDTLDSGAGLCDEAVVRFMVERGPGCIEWLMDRGVHFTIDEDGPRAIDGNGPLHLTREGGHSHRRVVHAADATGREVETTLASLASAHKRIKVREQCIAVDLIVDGRNKSVEGAYLLNVPKGRVEAVPARAVVLATGGANMAYLYSSNPHGASGDGIAMAWRAGCRVGNMEFMQFHPTCLFHKDARSFLISEALRGEGALLKLPGGERFMPGFDKRGELAPRDIVARAIDHEMKRLGIEYVHLDISGQSADFVKSHFPSIYARCLELNLNITSEPIPVVPAAHYTCGGVMTDMAGRTGLEGLYAIGETACTGVHGANRMASNSLLECLVFAEAAAQDLHRALPDRKAPRRPQAWDESRVTDSDEDVVVSHNWLELRRFMWDYVGIVRTDKRLQRAKHRVDLLKREIQEYYGNYKVSPDLIELRNLVTVADLIVRSALSRKESRGLHYTLDYPRTLKRAKPTVLFGRRR